MLPLLEDPVDDGAAGQPACHGHLRNAVAWRFDSLLNQGERFLSCLLAAGEIAGDVLGWSFQPVEQAGTLPPVQHTAPMNGSCSPLRTRLVLRPTAFGSQRSLPS